MANIPGIDNTPQFSQNVPGVQFPFRQEFGKQGRALEEVGQSVERAAVTGSEINDEIQRQHDIATSSEAVAQGVVKHNQLREAVAMSSPDGFVRDPSTATPDNPQGEIITNRDGTQKTIAQHYWENADQDFQAAQQNMTPRAAAMYREKMQGVIAENTVKLQNQGLILQAQNSEQRVQNIKDIQSRDMLRKFLPDTNSYYSGGPEGDGSVKQYPSAQKAYDAIQTLQLVRQQMGPVQGKTGMWGPTEVQGLKQKDASDLANTWMAAAKEDLLESNGSRAGLHQGLKDASSTASMQLHSLLDIVDGKDPESQRRAQKGLPTINNSLTPEQIEKWKSDLLSMAPAAKEVDKSEYELQKQQLNNLAKGATDLDKFFLSDLFQKTSLMGGGIGLTPDERIKDLNESVSTAISSVAISKVGTIATTDAKKAAAESVFKDAEKRWPQLATMIGVKDSSGFGPAITAEARKTVSAKLEEDAKQMRENPIGYAAGFREGPQSGSLGYKDKTAHAVATALDPQSGDPSLFAIFKPMGKQSVIETAQKMAGNLYSRMFNSTKDVSILQPEQFKDQAKRIVNANDPRMITEYFRQLDNQKGLTSAQKENFIQDLVHKGDLPQTYVDALNLKTPSEREAVWAKLKSGPAEMPDGMSQKVLDQNFSDHNKGLQTFIDRKYGVNSDIGRTTMLNYRHSWQESVKQAIGRGMDESDAYDYADKERDRTTGDVGVVAPEHHMWEFWKTPGPSVPVEYGKDFSDDQKSKINDTLLHAQSKETLSKYKFVPVPGSLPSNPNAPSDADNVANRAHFWSRVGGGWRLMMDQYDSENRPKNDPQPVQVYGSDGKPHYYEIKENDALAGPPQGAPQAVKPASKHAQPAQPEMMSK